MFAAVIFRNAKGPETTGVIPSSWVLRDDKGCSYPDGPSYKSDRLVKKNVPPEETWPKHRISVVKRYATYNEALEGVNAANYTSNLEESEDEEEAPGRETPAMAFPDFPSQVIPSSPLPSTSSHHFSVPARPIPTSPLHQISSSLPSTPSHHINFTGTSTPLNSRNTGCNCNRDTSNAISRMEAVLTDLYQEVIEMRQERRLKGGEDPYMERTEKMPFISMVDFEENEKQLTDPAKSKQMIKILKSLGGRQQRSMVYNCCRRTMTSELAQQFSYSGKASTVGPSPNQEKKPFFKTKLHACMKAAVLSLHPSGGEYEFKKSLSLWLQQAKHRRQEKKNENAANLSDTDQDM